MVVDIFAEHWQKNVLAVAQEMETEMDQDIEALNANAWEIDVDGIGHSKVSAIKMKMYGKHSSTTCKFVNPHISPK